MDFYKIDCSDSSLRILGKFDFNDGDYVHSQLPFEPGNRLMALGLSFLEYVAEKDYDARILFENKELTDKIIEFLALHDIHDPELTEDLYDWIEWFWPAYEGEEAREFVSYEIISTVSIEPTHSIKEIATLYKK